MEIKSFKKKKNNKYEIIFKNDNSVELYDDVIIKYNLLLNKKITDDKYNEIIEYNSNLDAYYLCLKYLNSKMRTKLELRKYLEKRDIDNKIINETLKKLSDNKIIDENLYIKSFVNDQINFSNIGPNKIADKLYTLGIKKDESFNYINTIDDNVWIEKIEKLVNKKIKTNKNYSSSMLKNKILSSLIGSGFYKEHILEVINKFNIETDSNIILKEYNKLKNKLSKKYDGENLEFQVKMKLKAKGFSNEEIDKI